MGTGKTLLVRYALTSQYQLLVKLMWFEKILKITLLLGRQ